MISRQPNYLHKGPSTLESSKQKRRSDRMLEIAPEVIAWLEATFTPVDVTIS